MKIEKDIDLFYYSTMRTHSVGKCLYEPNSVDELISLLREIKEKFHVLGEGSNVLFATYVKTPIISVKDIDHTLVLNEDGSITAGCSIRIQKLINFGKEHGLGGIEYLYSLPASVGGIVYMNAGKGRGSNKFIANHLKSVDYLDLNDKTVKTMNVDQREWGHRHSPFQLMDAIILNATFILDKKEKEAISRLISERIKLVSNKQEANKPSCGSVFNVHNRFIMYLIRGKRIGGACFSRKTRNWISNDKNGSFEDIIRLIKFAERIHKLLGLKIKREIRVFD